MKILVLSIACYLVATLITFSQTPGNPPTEKVSTPLALPADNVELVEVNGRAIIVTVLSVAADHQSVVIRTKDGKEMPILMSRLNADTIEKLTGNKAPVGKPAPIKGGLTPAQELVKQEAAKVKAAHMRTMHDPATKEAFQKYQYASAQEAAETLMSDTEIGSTLRDLTTYRGKFAADAITWRVSNFKMSMDVVPGLKLPSPDNEEVSLRPVFEKAGIVAMHQGEADCTMYAGMYLVQYWQATTGKKVMSRGEFLNLLKQSGKNTPNHVLFHNELIAALKHQHGKTPTVLKIENANPRLEHELIKEMIRKGRPVLIDVKGTGKYESHRVLCVGFTTKEGRTTFHYLDSYGPNKGDNGYKSTTSVDNGWGGCFWIE